MNFRHIVSAVEFFGAAFLDVMLNVTHNSESIYQMIVSYRGKETKDFIGGKRVKAFSGIDRSVESKLAQLDSATGLSDLARPGNRLENLKGDRKGQYSIRINDQWRVCFRWSEGDACEVEIADYH